MGFPAFFTCSALQDEKGVNELEDEEEEVEGASFMEGCGFLGFSYCGVAAVIHLGKIRESIYTLEREMSVAVPSVSVMAFPMANGQGLVGLFRGGHEAKWLGSRMHGCDTWLRVGHAPN